MKLRSATALCTLFALCASPVYAQTNDNADNAARMERLERDLQLLQRQIARGETGAPASPAAGASDAAVGGDAANPSLEAQLGRIEEEMRRLRGKFEESEFRDKQLTERLDRMQKDNEFRFNELSAAKAAAPASADAGAATAPVVTPAPAAKPTDAAPATPEVRSQTVPLSQPPHDLSAPAPATAPADAKAEGAANHDAEELNRMVEEVAGESSVPKEESPKTDTKVEALPAGETSAGDGQLKPPSEAKDGPREQYNTAFKLLNQTRYDEAAAQFGDFAKKYPKDPLIGNAYYWLGETHYIRRDYVKAADSFRQGFESLPTGPKAADNLLKLAMSLSAMQKNPEACVVLDQILVKFNKTSAAVTQKAQQERTRIACK